MWKTATLQEKYNFILDLFIGYIRGGSVKMNEELELWEDSMDIIRDKEQFERAQKLRQRIAESL